QPADMGSVLVRLMGSANLGSRRPIFRRYDHMVGGATVVPPGGDAAVLRVPGCRLGLAVTIDGNGRYCRLDPYAGGQIAVAEAARNVVATGARPLEVTVCLDFGNPGRSEGYWQPRGANPGNRAAWKGLGGPGGRGHVQPLDQAPR